MLLMLLYTLQGIPMGLGQSLQMLMQDKGLASMDMAVFSMIAYPFAFKPVSYTHLTLPTILLV